MSLTIITPVLNEITFLPLFLESVKLFADELIVVDGGSTEGSLELLKSYSKKMNLRLFEIKQTGIPYSPDWNESNVRNFLLDQASCEWVANLDADELFDEKIIHELPKLMNRKDVHVYQFPFVNFWRDPWTVRVNTPGDERWSNDIVRMWRNGMGIRYSNEKHHCKLQAMDGGGIWKLPRAQVDIPLFHYHYAFGKKIKYNDNRRGDVNMYDNSGIPDWEFHHEQYEIQTKPFSGKHPAIVRKYLENEKITKEGGENE